MARQAGLLITTFVMLICLQSCSKNIDDIYTENIKARGGADQIAALTAQRIAGKLSTGSDNIAFTIRVKRPDCIRMNITTEREDMILASNGVTVWVDTPYDSEGAIPMPEAEAVKLEEMYDVLFGLLQSRREKGDSMILLGKEKVGEVQAYKIQAIQADGAIQDIYINADTYLEIKRSSSAVYGKNDVETVSLYEDYREVAGVMIPHAVKEFINDRLDHTTIYTHIEANVEMPDTLFVMPVTP